MSNFFGIADFAECKDLTENPKFFVRAFGARFTLKISLKYLHLL